MHRMCFTLSNLNLQRFKVQVEPVRWIHALDKRAIKKNTSSNKPKAEAVNPNPPTKPSIKNSQTSIATRSLTHSTSLKKVKSSQEASLKKRKASTETNIDVLKPSQKDIILVDWENVGPSVLKHFDGLCGEVVFFMGKEDLCAKIPETDSWRAIKTGNKEKNSADIMLVQFVIERLLKGFAGRFFILTNDKGLQNILTLLQPASSQIILVSNQTNYKGNTIKLKDLRSAHVQPAIVSPTTDELIQKLTMDTMKYFLPPSEKTSILLLCSVHTSEFLTAFHKVSTNIPNIHFVSYIVGKNFPEMPNMTNCRDVPIVPTYQEEYIFTTMVKDLHILARLGYLRQFQSVWVSTLNPLLNENSLGILKSFSARWTGWFTSNQSDVKVLATDGLLKELIKWRARIFRAG